MNFIAKVLAHCIVNMKNENEKKKKKFLLADILNNPEEFMLTAYIEKEELVVRVKRKDVENGIAQT